MSPNRGVIAGGWTPTTLPWPRYNFIRFTKSIFHRGLIAGIVLLSASCTTIDNPDPYEGVNRRVMAFNDGADRMILKPLAKGYMNVTSAPVRSSVTNFYDNFAYPITIINQFLQGKVRNGFSDLGRFLANSTAGIFGLFDVATDLGLEYHDEDFGQTLGVWGVGSGAYLVIPLWGPVTTRSGVGDIASFYTHPAQYVEDDSIRYGLFTGWAIQTRASLLEAEDLVIGDRYLFIRDVYLQRREFLVNDGEIEEDPFFDTIE
jgi:phospholipid-binding lipoprotein MlaA